MGEAEVSKFTPATVILLIVQEADGVNVMVAETPVVALMLLERTIEGVVSAPLNMAGNKAGPPSRFAVVVSVVM